MSRLILVADDSPTIQRRALGILQAAGFDVETVSNGVAAIKKLPKMQPLLVLADVSMPGKDGYEVCEFVKTTAELQQVPVLLVVSDLEPYDERRGAEVRADGIIKKPFSPEDLMPVIAKFTGLPVAPPPPAAPPETPAASPPSLTGENAPEAGLPATEPFPQPMIEAALEALLANPEPTIKAIREPAPEPATEAPPEAVSGTPEPVKAAEEFAWVVSDLSSEPIAGAPPEAAAVSPGAAPEAVKELKPEPGLVAPAAPEPVAGPPTEEPSPGAPELSQEPIAEALPEEVLASHEAIPEVGEAPPEPAPVVPEAPPEPVAAAPPEGVSVSPEPVLEIVEDFSWVAPEPEPVAEAAPEGAPVGFEAMPEAAEAPAAEPVPVFPEAPPEPVAEVAPEAPSAVPAEEPVPAASALTAQQAEPMLPSPGVFGRAAEGAGPMLIDELAAAPPASGPPTSVEGQQARRVAATSLDSFSLTQAAEGQVYIAPPEAEATPSPEAGVVRPDQGPEPSPSLVDPEWVYVIVYKVVMRMAPPLLSPDLVEELIRTLTREITAELNSGYSQPS